MKLIADNKSIRKKMIDLNIKSITELSHLSGVSKPMIHHYLNGKTPLATTFIRLCSYLNVDPDDTILLTEIDDKEGKISAQ